MITLVVEVYGHSSNALSHGGFIFISSMVISLAGWVFFSNWWDGRFKARYPVWTGWLTLVSIILILDYVGFKWWQSSQYNQSRLSGRSWDGTGGTLILV